MLQRYSWQDGTIREYQSHQSSNNAWKNCFSGAVWHVALKCVIYIMWKWCVDTCIVDTGRPLFEKVL